LYLEISAVADIKTTLENNKSIRSSHNLAPKFSIKTSNFTKKKRVIHNPIEVKRYNQVKWPDSQGAKTSQINSVTVIPTTFGQQNLVHEKYHQIQKKENVNLRSLFFNRNCFRETSTRSDSTDLSCTSSRITALYLSAFIPFSCNSSNKTPAVLKTILDLWNIPG